MKPQLPLLTLSLAVAAFAAHAIPGAAEALQFDRGDMSQGELWRWLTAHLTHFDANHLAWDLGALLVLGWHCERESPRRTGYAIALAATAITPAVWLWQPQFETYRGLSGIDSALFGLSAMTLLRRREWVARLTGALAFAAIAAKCAYEVITARAAFAAGTGFAPVPLAHLIGLLAGAAAGISPRLPAIFRCRQTSC